MTELTNIDIEILNFINKQESIHIDEIKNKFPEISEIEYRIKVLSEQKLSQSASCYIPNSSYIIQKYKCSKDNSFSNIEATGIYEITELGKKTIRDFKIKNRIHKKEIWLKNAWIPIIVSVVTTLLVFGIEALLQMILK